MPSALPAPASTQMGRLYVLTVDAGGAAHPAGVLLLDPAMNALHARLRRDWDAVAPEEAEILEALQDDLELKSAELGAERLLAHLGDTLSNALRISEPREVLVENYDRALARLYRQHVPSTVRPHVTHLPRLSLAAAAGKFLDNEEVSEEEWIEAPPGLRLSAGMFAARIVGRSMEPRIPDGSLCVFRPSPAGSRQGKLVLVEYLGGGANDRYTVKRYWSDKTQSAEGAWRHERVRMEPLNPEFDTWELDPEEDRFRIVGEFVQVLF